MAQQLSLYYFGDTGTFDRFNPAVICKSDCSRALLYQIACHPPFSADASKLAALAGLEVSAVEDMLNQLQSIALIRAGSSGFCITFPTFVQSDLPNLLCFIGDAAQKIAAQITAQLPGILPLVRQLQNPTHASIQTLLYLILGSDTLDGMAFDMFADHGLLTASKPQAGGRDYLVIAYQDCSVLQALGDRLLCSNNSYRTKRYEFYSFGDSDGARMDFYRQLRLQQAGENPSQPVQIQTQMDALGDSIMALLGSNDGVRGMEQTDRQLLERFGYLQQGQLTVPVLLPQDQPLITAIGHAVLQGIIPAVQAALARAKGALAGCTPYAHGVPALDTANELWHLLFGHVMEQLAVQGTVVNPSHRQGEGRYIQAFKAL